MFYPILLSVILFFSFVALLDASRASLGVVFAPLGPFLATLEAPDGLLSQAYPNQKGRALPLALPAQSARELTLAWACLNLSKLAPPTLSRTPSVETFKSQAASRSHRPDAVPSFFRSLFALFLLSSFFCVFYDIYVLFESFFFIFYVYFSFLGL